MKTGYVLVVKRRGVIVYFPNLKPERSSLKTSLTSRTKFNKDIFKDANDRINVLLRCVERRAETNRLAATKENQQVLVIGSFLDLERCELHNE